jgi:amino-acid N-acetyltransferase
MQFYSSFGFELISFENLPPSLQGKFRLSQLAKKWIKIPVMFMYYQGCK